MEMEGDHATYLRRCEEYQRIDSKLRSNLNNALIFDTSGKSN